MRTAQFEQELGQGNRPEGMRVEKLAVAAIGG
jgi:hypothetical protein